MLPSQRWMGRCMGLTQTGVLQTRQSRAQGKPSKSLSYENKSLLYQRRRDLPTSARGPRDSHAEPACGCQHRFSKRLHCPERADGGTGATFTGKTSCPNPSRRSTSLMYRSSASAGRIPLKRKSMEETVTGKPRRGRFCPLESQSRSWGRALVLRRAILPHLPGLHAFLHTAPGRSL